MDRLTPQTSSFLHAETGHQRLHVGTVSVFEGSPPSYDEFRVHLEGVLPLVPRYRQRVQEVPLQAGRPVWVDDHQFRLAYHLRHTALPRPGSDEQLENLVARLVSRPLDRTRPLWEVYVVDGLSGDRWALVTKTHQAMIDGIGSSPLQSVLVSPSPEPAPAAVDRWAPRAGPSDARLVAEAVADLVISPTEMWRAARSAYRVQRAGLGWMGRRLAGAVGRRPPQHGSPSLHGPISRDRRWSFTALDLDAVRRIHRRHGVTTNDVIVAAIATGFRTLLLARGEMFDDSPLSVLFPMSVNSEGARYENEVTVVSADLPVTVRDPLERLLAISADLAAKVDSTVAADVLASLSGYAPPLLLALGTRMATLYGRYQTEVQSIVTNVPGPQEPRYVLGRRLQLSYPVVPLLEGIHIAVGAFSYAGGVGVGITGDYDSCPDLGIMAAAIGAGVDELAELDDAAPAVPA